MMDTSNMDEWRHLSDLRAEELRKRLQVVSVIKRTPNYDEVLTIISIQYTGHGVQVIVS